MEIRFLDQWACLLEPPGEACGESQWTTVRLSVFTIDDQPQAPVTHTPRGLHLLGPALFRSHAAQSVHDCPTFWLGGHETGEGFRESHIAFAAPSRDAVQEFFDAAVAGGAEVLHEPRVWPEYRESYFGVFVRDPDGNNVEAVCHVPE